MNRREICERAKLVWHLRSGAPNGPHLFVNTKPATEPAPWELVRTASRFLIASKRCEIDALETLLGMAPWVTSVSDLIHALQRERGASNLFLGSEGSAFGEERQDHIEAARAALGIFLRSLEGLEEERPASQDRTRLFSRIAHAVHALGKLADLRASVGALQISPKAAVEAYSDLIRLLLEIIFEAADAAVDPRISRMLVALFNLIEGKEFAGQERATGAGAFAVGSVDQATCTRLVGLLEEQNRCFLYFENFAEEPVRQLWHRLQHSADTREVENLRRVFCAKEGRRALERSQSKAWFAHTTRRIDAIKEIETQLITHLEELCREKLTQAQAGLREEAGALDAFVQADEEVGPPVVVFRGSAEMDGPGERAAITAVASGPRLGRSLVEMLHSQSRRLQKTNEELLAAKEALEDRKVIEKAKGLLMKHRNLTEPQAHKFLRDLSMKQNRRLAEVAAALVAMESVLG